MNNLNRPLIKQQAKQLISNHFFKLFIIQLIVYLCMAGIFIGGFSIFTVKMFREISPSSLMPETGDSDNADHFGFDDDFAKDFNNFGNGFEDFAEDFNNFGFNGGTENFLNDPDFDNMPYLDDDFEDMVFLAIFGFVWIMFVVSLLGSIVMALFSPLKVASSGLFVSFIRGKNFNTVDGIKSVFKDAFKHYGKYLGLVVLRYICTYFLSMLFVIPGIIYSYSTYFAKQIMADNPELSPSEALDLSKRIVKGNRMELFVMNLSFIGWFILCSIGLDIPYIYVAPYFETTNALYYENFRIRALQEGRVTEDDFLSPAQRYAKYANTYYGQPYQQNANPAQPYAPNGNYNPQYAPYGNPNPQAPYGNYNPQYPPYGNYNPQYPPYATAPQQSPPPVMPNEQPAVPSEQPAVPSEQPAVPSEQPAAPSEQPAVPSEQPAAPSEEAPVPSEPQENTAADNTETEE